MPFKRAPLLVTLSLCTACSTAPNGDLTRSVAGLGPLPFLTDDGTCFAEIDRQVRTRTEIPQVEILPAVTAEDDTPVSPPVLNDQPGPIPQVVSSGTRFTTLCPEELTPTRVATLQRALKARLSYDGPITGTYDAATKDAVQAYQAPWGIDSPELSRSLAKRFGLIPFVDEASLGITP